MSTLSPAEIYHQRFVPALFAQWGSRLTAQAEVSNGMHVLDVGCGTGVLAAAAAELAGSHCVTAIDCSDEMLQVARRHHPAIDWRCGMAEQLPFADSSFDAVLSQFAMMFFESRTGALAEMWRVLKPGGRLLVAVCDALYHSPGYAVFAELLHALFGTEVAAHFRAPFSAGDADLLRQLCEQSGLPPPRIEQLRGQVRFDSVEDMIATERACVFTLGGLLSESQFSRLLREARTAFQPFVSDRGSVEFAMPVLTLMVNKTA